MALGLSQVVGLLEHPQEADEQWLGQEFKPGSMSCPAGHSLYD